MSFNADALRQTITVADGGWSTQLQMRGVPTNVPAESANLTHPDTVVALGTEYVDAGARFLTTNTFAANEFTLARRDLGDKVTEVNRRGAELARAAADKGVGVLVVGSVGPSGKILAVKETTEDVLREKFAVQIGALAAGGADIILLETCSEIAEVVLAIRVAKEIAKLPVIASMSFDSGPQRTRTMMGTPADKCATALDEAVPMRLAAIAAAA